TWPGEQPLSLPAGAAAAARFRSAARFAAAAPSAPETPAAPAGPATPPAAPSPRRPWPAYGTRAAAPRTGDPTDTYLEEAEPRPHPAGKPAAADPARWRPQTPARYRTAPAGP